MTKHIADFRQAANYYEPWSIAVPERDLFLDWMISELVPNKKVLETGSRAGLFCYSSIIHGCKHVIGLEFIQEWINVSNKTFEALEVSKEKYDFISQDATKFDYSGLDVVLCLGVLYNLPDSHKHSILKGLEVVPISLIEFWCIEDNNLKPQTFESHNDLGPQYKPNKLQAELLLKEHGFFFKEVTPEKFKTPNQSNRFYLCQRFSQIF